MDGEKQKTECATSVPVPAVRGNFAFRCARRKVDRADFMWSQKR
jgi:hypothetical protein